MRSFLSLIVLLPFVLGCDNPANDKCAGAFSKSSAAAAAFCKTYTKTVNTATTGLPAFASACSSKPAKLSSACSCLTTSQAAATTLKTTAKSTSKGAPSTTPAGPTTTAKPTTVKPTTGKVTSTPAQTFSAGSCHCTAYSQVASALESCTAIVLDGIAVPAKSSLDLTKVKSGSTIIFAGKTTFGYTPDNDFDPIILGGANVLITGASGHVIDGSGQLYWDGKGSNGGQAKPDHFIVVDKMTNSVIQNLNIINWPVHCFDVTHCDGVTITNLHMDNSDGDASNSKSGSLPAAHNSDGFDFSSSNNMVLSNTRVINQDDCVAVTSGVGVKITGMYCYGGHGLSIGSVGGKSNNVVQDITFENSEIHASENGCRIKTNSGTTGSVTNVAYNNIYMTGISKYGIDIQQDYLNGGPTGKPTNGVTISGISFSNVTGTATSSAKDYYVLCGSGSCSSFSYKGVSIKGGAGDSCNYPTSGCP